MQTKTYICQNCACQEFISRPSLYDIFEHQEGKLVFVKSEIMEEKIELFCRECSEKLDFDQTDLTF
ncbi:hypothetical protein [Hugenholtzia roseola]|uniref:hypothetical protein n=1 Tax=Hugenholtzia roseola TaxID=1002 RepID=UPI00047BF73D|nr:hypothetical protein [Hugenholtzia roseola]